MHSLYSPLLLPAHFVSSHPIFAWKRPLVMHTYITLDASPSHPIHNSTTPLFLNPYPFQFMHASYHLHPCNPQVPKSHTPLIKVASFPRPQSPKRHTINHHPINTIPAVQCTAYSKNPIIIILQIASRPAASFFAFWME
jgi:hypothetical protein